MNLRQLEAFHEIMLTGTVSGAARNLGRTQPAISAQIAALEEQLGYKLFERRGGRLHPIPEAHYVFEEAREIFDRFGKLQRTMSAVRTLERGTIRIVSMLGPSLFFLPRLVSRFLKDRPEMTITMLTRSSLEVQAAIASQQYDFGIMDLGIEGAMTDSPLISTVPSCYECVCALPAQDPLAERNEITPQDLAGKPLGALFQGHALHRSLQQTFETAGIDFRLSFESQMFVPHFTLVEDGALYSIVDPISAASYKTYRGPRSGIAFRPFRPSIPFEFGVVTPTYRPRSRLTEAFLAAVTGEIEDFAEAWKDTVEPLSRAAS